MTKFKTKANKKFQESLISVSGYAQRFLLSISNFFKKLCALIKILIAKIKSLAYRAIILIKDFFLLIFNNVASILKSSRVSYLITEFLPNILIYGIFSVYTVYVIANFGVPNCLACYKIFYYIPAFGFIAYIIKSEIPSIINGCFQKGENR